MELTKELIGQFAEDYKKQGAAAVIAENAVKNNGIHKAAERETCVVTDNAPVFSIDVDSEAVANQRQAGFCWDYSGLNFLRWHIEKKLDLPHGSFQLSQVYTIFYDKLEKSNFFLEQIVKYADSGLDDRRIDFLLASPQQDGGDWDPFCALVEKYGVVPIQAMPDTAPSKNTAEVNNVLNKLLRQDAQKLRDAIHEGKGSEAIDHLREEMLSEVYRVLCVSFGEPPATIDFEYKDSKKKYHADFGLTPLEFYKKYLGQIDLHEYQAIMNLPTVPYEQRYTIDMTHEVQGGTNPVSYINTDIDTLKAYVIAQLKAGTPVWFGCDVTQDADFDKGILSQDLYDVQSLFGITWTMDKAQRFQTLQAVPTHAMMIGGVDLVDDKPVRWKIENSWGATVDGKPVGHNGYFIADDGWFDQYVFEVAIPAKDLSAAHQKLRDAEAQVLPYWNAFNPVPLSL